jgi:hypothetical protein
MADFTAPARRFRISHATVVAYLALFVAMGGTATAVSYVVSSNSQLGPGTVSGSKPTTGKHDNIINGTVNGADVADNSLGGKDIDESKLGTVPNADALGGHPASYYGHAIPFGISNFVPNGLPSFSLPVATLDGLSVYATCDLNSHTAGVRFETASSATLNLYHVDNANHVAEKGVAFDGNSPVSETIGAGARIEGQAIYRNNSDGAVVIIDYHVYQPTCEVIGMASAQYRR